MTRLIDADALLEALSKYDSDYFKYIKNLITNAPTVQRERFVVKRQFLQLTLYAFAHPHGVFDWGVISQAVKLDTKLEAEALIASMALYGDDSVSVEVIRTNP